MGLRRLLRHLWYGRWQLRRRLPERSLRAITEAIRRAEKSHSGEIRCAVEVSLDAARLWRGVSPRERAVEVFSLLRVWDTEHNNGVLIYLLLADRAVEIVADRGVHRRVGDQGWQAICREMEAAFRNGHFEQGLVEGVQAVGRHLSRHFAGRDASGDELSNRPTVL